MDALISTFTAASVSSPAAVAYWLALAFCGLGVALGVILPWARLAYRAAAICAAAAGIAAVIAGVGTLSGFAAPVADIPSALPFGFLLIRLDPLGAFFLLVIGIVVTPVAIFSIGYFTDTHATPAHRGHEGATPALGPYGALLCLLIASLMLIVSAGDAVLFLIAWESMAFLSYLVGAYHYTDRMVASAMFRMLAVSEAGTTGVIAAFLALYGAAGSFAFADLHAAGPTLPIVVRSVIFLVVLVGFGAKLGILPFQFWLVDAHPQAPGPISGLLSAIIIELALYGILRFDLDLLGVGPAWWGLVAVILGMVTALGGVLYSLVQNNLKRLLAYSSVEHSGILLVGLGATLTFASLRLTALAAIAGMATLYHVLNHATFKGLLFLGAGAVEHATGSVALDRLGGLARRLPLVSGAFLVGALAISAVPPFNGFVSEWMLLESLLQSFAVNDLLARVILTICGAVLALVAGLGVTAFVRAVGVPFLGLPRSVEAERAHRVDWTMRVGMVWLALLCLALGVSAPLVLAGLDRVTTPLLGESVYGLVVPPLFTGHPGPYAPLVGLGGGLFGGLIPGNGLVIIAAPAFSTIDSPTYLFLAEIALLALIWVARRAIQPLGATRRAPVWAGGISRFTARMTYSGVAFSNPLRLIFNPVYRSRATTELIEPSARHQRGRISYEQEIPKPFDREVYGPLRRAVDALATRVKVIQSGDINQYLAYIFGIVLLILLLRVL